MRINLQSRMFSLAVILFFSVHLTFSNGAALMSVDLGNEFMKIGLIKSGHSMEIALDQESARKSPTIVALKENERFFGSSAENIAAKQPHLSFRYLPSLLGKTMKHPVVAQYQSRFPYHKMSYVNGTISFSLDSDLSYTVEELVSMLLEYAKDVAEAHGDEKIKSAVITIPSYWSQSERTALLRAAQIVNIDVLQIMNSNSAVALHFGIFRKKTFNATPQYYMFYDVGSQDTTATVVSYKSEAGSDPELAILGVGYDETFGTSNLIYFLTEHLVKGFIEKHKVSPRENKRSMGKFMKEAKRVLKILSANNEVFAQIENVFDNKDFSLKVTRTEFEEMNSEYFDRLEAPFLKALSEAQLSIDTIQEVILMGGGTRVPKVQEKLLQLSKKPDLGKSINTDEASALGAVYQAAHHSPLFKVVKFDIKDFNNFPISTSFKIFDEDNKDSKKLVDKVNLIYKLGNAFPQKRALSILKHASPLNLKVFYPDRDTKKNFGTDTLMEIEILDYEETTKPHIEKGANLKGLKVHFYMDMNGIISMTGVDAKLEIPGSKAEDSTGDGSGTLKSISDKISSFFGSDNNSTEAGSEDALKLNASEKAAHETVTEKPKTDTKPIKLSEPIKYDAKSTHAATLSKEKLESSQQKLESLRANEKRRKELEKTKNDLESYIFACREKIETQEFIQHSTEEERKKIEESAKTIYDWYEEQGNDTPVEEYSKRFNDLTNLSEPIQNRVKESIDRPKAFTKLSDSIKLANELFKTFNSYKTQPQLEIFFPGYNFTTDFPMVEIEKREEMFQNTIKQFQDAFTQTEIDAFVKMSEDNESWMKEFEKKAEKLAKNVDPEITSDHIMEKTKDLLRLVQSFQEKVTNQMRSFTFEFRKQLRKINDDKVAEVKAASKNETISEQTTPANDETTKEEEKKTESTEEPEKKEEVREEL